MCLAQGHNTMPAVVNQGPLDSESDSPPLRHIMLYQLYSCHTEVGHSADQMMRFCRVIYHNLSSFTLSLSLVILSD